MAAIAAFNAPTYTIDITPFVPLLANGDLHNFTINVRGQGGNGSTNPDWIISGSVAITLDPGGMQTTGCLTSHHSQSSVINTPLPTDKDGHIRFETKASRQLVVTGKVVTGSGVHRSIRMDQNFEFTNTQAWLPGGNYQV